jgi:hypothetical protein
VFKLNYFGDNRLQIDSPGGIREGLKISANLQYGEWITEHWIVPVVIRGILVSISLFVILIPGLRRGWHLAAPLVSHIRILQH